GRKAEKCGPLRRRGERTRCDGSSFSRDTSGPPVVDLVRNRFVVKFFGGKPDEAAIVRAEKALPDVIGIVEDQLAKNQWLLGDDFTLVDCAYAPVINVTEKAGFSFEEFPKVRAYMDAIRSRPGWQKTPKLPGL